jgi:DNA polymerase II small subunit
MQSILQAFSDHGTFIQPDALQYIRSKQNPKDYTSFLLKNLKEYPLVLTVDVIKQLEESLESMQLSDQQPENILKGKEAQKKLLSELYNNKLLVDIEEDENLIETTEIELISNVLEENNETILTPTIDIRTVKGWKPEAKEYDSEVKIVGDVTGNSTCEGTTQDFVKLFRNRYDTLRKTLRNQRREIIHTIPIDRIKNGMSEVQLIGIVTTVKTTVNGHRLIEIEDETGTVTLMALKNNHEVLQQAHEVVLDEVIGIVGKLSRNGDLIIINNIIFPDIRVQHERKKAPVPICAAFLSDIHIGSKMFMTDEFKAFLRWINGDLGNSRQRTVASKIKYLLLPGDLVDGIGIYPNQEKELSITNIQHQYEALAKWLEHIPSHITIIMQPGNHDAVRPAEPQPAFEKEIQDLFSGKEYIFVGNPCYLNLHGIDILSYHGQSLLDYATNIQSLNYNQPTEVMKIMLKKRHLSPIYGGYTPLAPEHTDYMIIGTVPDIFVTGHVHTSFLDNYRGVTLINASSWQSQTSYQKMLNFVPDSAKLPIVNFKTGNATTMDFTKNNL